MIGLTDMLSLLEQKKTYLLHYEREMETLPLLPTEELEACIQRGDVLIEKLKELDERLVRLARENGAAVMSTLNHECDRGLIDADMGKLYDAALEVKAVANRIVNNDGVIRERINHEKEKAMEGIKDINAQSARVAGRYRQTTTTGTRPESEWKSRNI